MKIFGRKFESTESHAMCQQVVVKRGNLKLLIVNLQDNTGLCHSVIFASKTSVVDSIKRELR